MDINQFTDDFVDEWNGKNLNINGAHINFDGRYGTQCMDLWNYWWTELGLSGITRNPDAAAVWENNKGTYYQYFDGILPDQPAKKGDVFIYNRKAWGTGYGHIGIVLEDLGNSIRVFETNGLGDGYEDAYMNQYGSPPRIKIWPKTNLYGYLRYIQEEDMASAQDIANTILDTRVERGGDMGGTLSLREVIKWYDPNIEDVARRVWSYRNPGIEDDRDAYQTLRDIPRTTQAVVADIPDNIAQEVIDALSKRLSQ